MDPKTNLTSEEDRALQEQYLLAQSAIGNASDLMIKRLQAVKAKEAKWNELKRKVLEDAEQAPKIIKLDVGGKIFIISKSQLLSEEASYFHAMLASGQWQLDGDGAYFIDRDPEHFYRVLGYLRTGKISFTGLRADQIDSLKETLDYLHLGNAYPPVEWDSEKCGPDLRLSVANQVVSSMKAHQSVRSLYTCVRYSVRLDAIGKESGVFIGFAPEMGFDPLASNERSCGWYLDASTGKLHSKNGVSECSYGSKVEAKSEITCIYDPDSSSISFEVDGESLGVAYSDLPKAEVYAAVCFSERNVKMTIVD